MFDKNALKSKMGKTINIKITVDPQDDDIKTDLAPDVKDSDEEGVVTDNEQPGEPGMMDGNDDKPYGDRVAQSLIDSAPQENMAAGKTLDSIARERAMKRMEMKKGLKG